MVPETQADMAIHPAPLASSKLSHFWLPFFRLVTKSWALGSAIAPFQVHLTCPSLSLPCPQPRAQSPAQTVPVRLSCVTLASQSQPSHHVLSPSTRAVPCHQSKPSWAVGQWQLPSIPSPRLSPESPTPQANGLRTACLPPIPCAHPAADHASALPIPHLAASASSAFCSQFPCSASPGHFSSSQAITPCPTSPGISLQLLVSPASQSLLLFPRFLVLSLGVSFLHYSNQGLSSTRLPRSQKRGGWERRAEGGIGEFSLVPDTEQQDVALKQKGFPISLSPAPPWESPYAVTPAAEAKRGLGNLAEAEIFVAVTSLPPAFNKTM